MELRFSVIDRLQSRIWDVDTADKPVWQRFAVHAARVTWVQTIDLVAGQLTLRAMSLVYTTLLSIVPALAITFAILKAFGVHHDMEGLLLGVLEPLGEQGIEVVTRIMGFVERVDTGVLGSAGIAFLIYTVVTMMLKIEGAFNAIWHARSSRSLPRRVADFLSIGLLGPLLIFTAIGLLAAGLSIELVEDVSSMPPFSWIAGEAGRVLPFGILTAAFFALYMLIPNTRVGLWPALAGAIAAAVAWRVAGWAFASFVAASARYAEIYSAFASGIVFMIWLYTAWLILLTGCSIAYYVQNRRYLSPGGGLVQANPEESRGLALEIMRVIGEHFYVGEAARLRRDVAAELNVPPASVAEIVVRLESHGLILPTADHESSFLPARPLDQIPLEEVLRAAEPGARPSRRETLRIAHPKTIQDVLARVKRARSDALKGATVADLVGAEKLEDLQDGNVVSATPRPAAE